jgi:predicted nucleic acid-binding protein
MSHKHLFIDTNVLVYAHDLDAGSLHVKARGFIEEAWNAPYPPAISTQVLQELYVSLSKKGASIKECESIVSLYYPWEVVAHDLALVSAAIQYRNRYQFSLWDSLIVAAAKKAHASELITEDLQHGQLIDGLEVVNPFK